MKWEEEGEISDEEDAEEETFINAENCACVVRPNPPPTPKGNTVLPLLFSLLLLLLLL